MYDITKMSSNDDSNNFVCHDLNYTTTMLSFFDACFPASCTETFFIRASASDLVNASRRYLNEHSDNDNRSTSLKRVFRLFDLVIFGICSTVGSGIFIMAGTAGKWHAGSSLILSIVIGGFSQMCTTLAHAEFSSRMPVIGSVYTYNYNASGEFVAFLMAWQGILDPLSASINAIGATGYFKSFLIACGVDRHSLDNSLWFGHQCNADSMFCVHLSAPLLILVLTLFAVFDVALSKNFMNYLSIWNISLLLLFIMSGAFLIDADIWTNPCEHTEFDVACPADAENSFFPFGVDGTFHGALIAFWAFTGIENIVNVAEECVDPMRDIPRGIYLCLLCVSLLYIAVIVVVNGMLPFQAIDTTASLSEALAVHDELVLHQMISLGAASTMAVLSFASLIASTRRWFRIALDGLCLPVLSYIHPRFRTPLFAILLYSLIAMTAALLFDLGSILAFGSVAVLFSLTSVSVGLLIIRYAPPSHEEQAELDGAGDGRETYWWNESRLIALSWSYFLLALIFGFVAVNREYFAQRKVGGMWVLLIVLLVMMLLAMMGLFAYFHYKYPWRQWVQRWRTHERQHKIYYMPGCPYLPCMLIVLNCYMAAGIGLLMMAELLLVFALGVPVYFGYSYRHSKLRRERSTQRISAMIALTAMPDEVVDSKQRHITAETDVASK